MYYCGKHAEAGGPEKFERTGSQGGQTVLEWMPGYSPKPFRESLRVTGCRSRRLFSCNPSPDSMLHRSKHRVFAFRTVPFQFGIPRILALNFCSHARDDGELPVAPSAITADGNVSMLLPQRATLSLILSASSSVCGLAIQGSLLLPAGLALTGFSARSRFNDSSNE